jgi:hypothetical protein
VLLRLRPLQAGFIFHCVVLQLYIGYPFVYDSLEFPNSKNKETMWPHFWTDTPALSIEIVISVKSQFRDGFSLQQGR